MPITLLVLTVPAGIVPYLRQRTSYPYLSVLENYVTLEFENVFG